jgi:hypothetical protein
MKNHGNEYGCSWLLGRLNTDIHFRLNTSVLSLAIDQDSRHEARKTLNTSVQVDSKYDLISALRLLSIEYIQGEINGKNKCIF